MKSLIVYSSQTGNTQKLADIIYNFLSNEKNIFKIEEAPNPSGFDLIFLGFWLKAGNPDPKTQEYLKQITKQKLFLFSTHGASKESQHAKNAMENAKKMAPEADIIGCFNCPGEVTPKILEKARSKAEPPVWLKDAPAAKGHPNDADCKELKDLLKQCL